MDDFSVFLSSSKRMSPKTGDESNGNKVKAQGNTQHFKKTREGRINQGGLSLFHPSYECKKKKKTYGKQQ